MSIKEKALGRLAEFVIRFRVPILIAAAALFVLSLFAAQRIRIVTQMKDMLPDGNPKVASFNKITDEFGGGSSLIVTVEGADKKLCAGAAERLVERIRGDGELMRLIHTINLRADRDFAERFGLLTQKPADIERVAELYRGTDLLYYVRALNDSFEETYTGDEAEESIETSKQENDAVSALNQIESFTAGLTDYLRSGGEDPGKSGGELAGIAALGDEYAYSPDGTILMFTMTLNFPVDDIDSTMILIRGVQETARSVEGEYPGVSVGYAGDVAANADEQTALSGDMFYPSLIALLLILTLFLFSFSQIRAIVFSLLSLTAGIVFTFGIVGITIGEINMITSILGVLLIGMGIDYGIQVVTNFTTFRNEGYGPEDAVRQTFIRSGSGILIAALTTSASFFVLMLSDSKALTQFGFVAGIGIITCFLTMITALPALLLLFGKRELSKIYIPQFNYGLLTRIGTTAARRRGPTLIVGAAVTLVFLAVSLLTLRLEYNIMKLEPQKAVSTVTIHKIIDAFDINPMGAMIAVESIEEARRLTDILEKKRGVAEVSSISALIPAPEDQEERLAKIAELRPGFTETGIGLSYTPKIVEELCREIERLEDNVIEVGDLSVAGLGEENRILRKRTEMIGEIFGAERGKSGKEVFKILTGVLRSDQKEAASMLSALDSYFAPELWRTVRTMFAVDRPVTPDDLPESYRKRFFSDTMTSTLVSITPTKEATKDSKNILRFTAMLDEVSPEISGTSPLSVAFMNELFRESRKSALYVLVLVFAFMLLTFRSLRYSLAASVPLITGLVWMFGLLGITKTIMSGVNVAMTPLVIGIGIAYGSYMVSRYLTEGRDMEKALDYTAKAVFLSAFTTMVGFGSLWLMGSFTSISSLGALLFLGVTSTLVTTLTILPAVLGTKRKAGML